MVTRYLCPSFVREVTHSEATAIDSWVKISRLGSKAFAQCRVEESKKYLEAAVDISLIRIQSRDNHYFNEHHITNPLEVLLEILLFEANVGEFTRLKKHITADFLERRKAKQERAIQLESLLLRFNGKFSYSKQV